jgi:hypothetical protein
MKIVINSCFGGFGLSEKAENELEKIGKLDLVDEVRWGDDVIKSRTDKDLVSIVEKLGQEANGNHADLKVIEIPDDVIDNVYIHEYDGVESIFENHRIWN